MSLVYTVDNERELNMNKKYALNKVNMHLSNIKDSLDKKDKYALMSNARMLFSSIMIEKVFKRYYPEFHKSYKENIQIWDREIQNEYEREHGKSTNNT
jgi:hypothetical protein